MPEPAELTALTDDELGAALHDLGTELVLPALDVDAITHAVATPPFVRQRPPLAAVAAVVLVVAAAAVLAIAPARSAVADWLGIGRTAVEVDPDVTATTAPEPALPTTPPDAPAPADAEIRTDAAPLLPFVPRLPTAELVGSPIAWELRTDRGAAELVVVYADVVIGGRATDPSTPPALKVVPSEGVVLDATSPAGITALWVEGQHVRQIEGVDEVARSALLWVDDGVEWRIEGAADLDRALAIADSFS